MSKNVSQPIDTVKLSKDIQKIVLDELATCPVGKLQLPDNDLKGVHDADKKIYECLVSFFHTQQLPANIYIESSEPIFYHDTPEFCIFIDPIDGSLNRDLKVGDPSISIAYAYGQQPRFSDIFSGYVYGLHSGDSYYAQYGKSYWQPHNHTEAIEISCDTTVTKLEDAILYYNDGYGQNFAKQALLKAGALPLKVKHHNAFDNTAMEICQICRGVAHLRVEARSYHHQGKLKGSDHANMLAAFSIGKTAGLLVTDLAGNVLDNLVIEIDNVQDFICASHENLLSETLDVLANNQALLMALFHEK